VIKIEERIRLAGWKGKGEFLIHPAKDYFKIIEKRKSKESLEVYEIDTLIPKKNVEILWNLIKDNCDKSTKYGYRFLVRLVLNHYKFHEKEGVPLDFFMEVFNGGRNRASYYFPYLYYPLKILEHQKVIHYSGKGELLG
jgi:hypothetical protein